MNTLLRKVCRVERRWALRGAEVDVEKVEAPFVGTRLAVAVPAA